MVGCSGWPRSHFFRVCWNRSTLPQVVGCPGVEFFWTMPRRRSSTLPLVDAFVEEYNDHRPHRSLEHRATQPRSTRLDPRPLLPPVTGTRTPTTASATTRSTRRRQDHLALPGPDVLHRHRPNPHRNPRHRPSPGPRHPRHQRPPPANPCSASSSSTHPSATKAPDTHQAPPAERRRAEPTSIGFGPPGCLETSHRCGGRDLNLRPLDAVRGIKTATESRRKLPIRPVR